MSAPVSGKLRALKAYDPDFNNCHIHLDANESFLPLPDAMLRKIGEKTASVEYNRYPDPLASGVCAAFGRRYGISPEYITAGNGSDELISIILNTFLERGEPVLITRPDFSMYELYCALAEVRPVVLGKTGDLTFDPDEMIELANRGQVRLILFSNPCNPTGLAIPADEVLRIAANVACPVVVDEAYMDFWDQPIVAKAPALENVIVLKTLSKIGFAAARLGFAVANAELTGYLRAAKSPYNVNTMSQAAGEVFLEDKAYFDNAAAVITASRDALAVELNRLAGEFPGELRVFDSHSNFVTAQVQDAPARHEALKALGISVRLMAGTYFRITTGTPEENSAFAAALRSLLERKTQS